MKLYDFKDYYIIYSLLNSTEDNPVTSSSLAETLQLSNKTIQNTLNNINEFCLKNGFEVASKSGNGFYAIIHEINKVSRLKQTFDIFFARTYVIDSKDAVFYANFIIYLINQDNPVTIDTICQNLFISKSTVYSVIKKTEPWFTRSGLKLCNYHNRGLYCDGTEFDKRLMVTFSLATQFLDYDYALLFGNNFRIPFHFYDEIPMILNLLDSYSLSLNDDRFYGLLSYLSYSEYRYQRNNRLKYDGDLFLKLNSLNEWKFATELLNRLNLPNHDDPSEIIALTTFIIIYNDRLVDINIARYGEYFYSGIDRLYKHLCSYMENRYPALCQTANFHSQLEMLCCRIYFIYELGYNNKAYTLPLVYHKHNSNALIKYLARNLIVEINEYFDGYLENRYSNYIILFFRNLLYSANTPHKNMSLLFISKDGKVYSSYVFQWLNHNLNPQPYRIRQLSLLQASSSNLDEYDLILTDYDSISTIQNKYKVYQISEPIDYDCSFITEYYKISNNRTVSINDYLNAFPHIFVHDNMKIINTEGFLTELDNDLDGFGNIPVREFRKHYRPINYMGENKCLLVPFFYKDKDQHENILSIYFNGEHHLKYSTMVFFSYCTDFSIRDLVFLLNICNEFCKNPAIFETLAAYKTAEK